MVHPSFGSGSFRFIIFLLEVPSDVGGTVVVVVVPTVPEDGARAVVAAADRA